MKFIIIKNHKKAKALQHQKEKKIKISADE
jgi:hypothetical protein